MIANFPGTGIVVAAGSCLLVYRRHECDVMLRLFASSFFSSFNSLTARKRDEPLLFYPGILPDMTSPNRTKGGFLKSQSRLWIRSSGKTRSQLMNGCWMHADDESGRSGRYKTLLACVATSGVTPFSNRGEFFVREPSICRLELISTPAFRSF